MHNPLPSSRGSEATVAIQLERREAQYKSSAPLIAALLDCLVANAPRNDELYKGLPMHAPRTSSGFTFIELAIVVAVIALIIGGVLVGGNLIRQAELRSVMSDAQLYTQAIGQFKEKYKYLPGDFPDAQDYWGVNPDGCSAGSSTLRRETCDGNGDGKIATVAGYKEPVYAWQHLANAGMTDDTYSGLSITSYASAAYDIQAGINVPKSALHGSGFSIWNHGIVNSTADDALFFGVYNHTVDVLQAATAVNPSGAGAPLLSPGDAWEIDNKVDDGKPAYGKVTTYKPGSAMGYSPNCATTSTASTAEYDVQSDEIRCRLTFITGL